MKNNPKICETSFSDSHIKLEFNFNKEKLHLLQILRNLANGKLKDIKSNNAVCSLNKSREEYRNSIKRKLSRNTPAQEIKSVKVNQFSAEYSEVRESNSKVCKSKRSSSISDRTPQSKKNYEFSSRITAPTKSSEMKLQRKCHQDVDLAPKLEQKEIESSNSENDSDSFTTPVISAGIKIEDINVNSVGEDKTPHISASQELFTHDCISSEINYHGHLKILENEPKISMSNKYSAIETKLDELQEENVDILDRTTFVEYQNPIELAKKLKETNSRKSLNFTYSAVENFIKDLYTIHNIDSPNKEENKHGSKIKSNKEYLVSSKGNSLNHPYTTKKTVFSSGSKAKIDKCLKTEVHEIKSNCQKIESDLNSSIIRNSCNDNIRKSITKNVKPLVSTRNTFSHSKF